LANRRHRDFALPFSAEKARHARAQKYPHIPIAIDTGKRRVTMPPHRHIPDQRAIGRRHQGRLIPASDGKRDVDAWWGRASTIA
jgi:hypothetical protein